MERGTRSEYRVECQPERGYKPAIQGPRTVCLAGVEGGAKDTTERMGQNGYLSVSDPFAVPVEGWKEEESYPPLPLNHVLMQGRPLGHSLSQL